MDDMKTRARNDATSLVARDFEPTRIERQLLARAFELLCEIQSLPSTAPPYKEPLSAKWPASAELDERRIA